MIYEKDIELTRDLVRTYGPLTENQIVSFFARRYERDPRKIEKMLRQMATKKSIFIDNGIVKFFPKERLKVKKIAAFWAYIGFCTLTDDRIFKATYPSEIGFVTDSVYLITVCEDPSSDSELISLREKKKEKDITHCIVGINLSVDDIRKEILPEEDFLFMEIRCKDILHDIPQISGKKITRGENK